MTLLGLYSGGFMTHKNDGQSQEVHLWITQGLQNLLGPELAALNAGMIDTNVLQQGNFLAIGEPLCLHGRVGDEEEDGETDEDGYDSKDDKHDAPAGEGSTLGNVLEGIGHSTTKDLAQAETKVPEGEARSLLGLGVPLAANQHERGSHGGLEKTQEHSRHQESPVVERSSTTGSGDAPESHVDAQPLGSWNHLEEPDCKRGDVNFSVPSHETKGGKGH